MPLIDRNSIEILLCTFDLPFNLLTIILFFSRELHKVAEMDLNLLAISECISLYYEVLALITYQCNTRSCLKVRKEDFSILIQLNFPRLYPYVNDY